MDILEDKYVNNAFERAIESIKNSLEAAQARMELYILNHVYKVRDREIEAGYWTKCRPCPFCGNKELSIDLVYPAGNDDFEKKTKESFMIYCEECETTGPIVYSKNSKKAVKAWNKRK